MRGNIPINELATGEDVWLAVSISSIREVRRQQGHPFFLAMARNDSGKVILKIPAAAVEEGRGIGPGLWGIVGRLERFQDQHQFVVSECRPISLEKYREIHGVDPILPQAYTIDIETIPLPGFRERAVRKLKRSQQLGDMSPDQQERYSQNPALEEERAYRKGSLSACHGRILSIAAHVGPFPGAGTAGPECEIVFGIGPDGAEQEEAHALSSFIALFDKFDPDTDLIVGHNVIAFDLPFIFQRCLVNDLPIIRGINLGEYEVRGVYDTMRRWWLGARNRISLDDLAWALGIESSKSEEVEGSRVIDLYNENRLAEIREYNLADVRLTRKVFERMIGIFG